LTLLTTLKDSSELFQVSTDKKLQREFKKKRNQLGIDIAKEEEKSIGVFQLLERSAKLKPKSRILAAEFLAWLRKKNPHPYTQRPFKISKAHPFQGWVFCYLSQS